MPWPEIAFLFDNLVPGEKLLDLGCGNGRFFEFFKSKKVNYIGLDYSKDLIELARQKFPETKFLVADAMNLPFENNFFDKVYTIAVLHHIPSKGLRLKFLREARRVLKPGGLLVLTVWKFQEKKERSLLFKFTILKLFGLSKLDFRDVLEPWGKKLNRYYHCFSRKELIDLIKEAGLDIRDSGVVKNERGNRQNIYLMAKKV